MALETLHDVLNDQLKDLFDAEKQLIRALPKMAKAATDEELKAALEEHLEVTKGQADRMASIFEAIEEPAKGKKCEAMKGLILEGEEVIQEKRSGEPAAVDAAIIAAAQKIEHYEMSGYGLARAFAEALGYEEAVSLLQMTLDEESEANEKLTEIAETVNAVAAELGAEEEESEDEEEYATSSSTNGRGSAAKRQSKGKSSGRK